MKNEKKEVVIKVVQISLLNIYITFSRLVLFLKTTMYKHHLFLVSAQQFLFLN